MTKRLTGLALLLFCGMGVMAQKNVSDFLNLGKADGRLFAIAYLQPYGDMLGKSLNGGWYNSADVHKVGGFDFTLGVNMSMVPASARSFDVKTVLAKTTGSLLLKNDANFMAPNIAGRMSTRPVLRKGGKDVLTLPDGANFNVYPMPVVQLGVGLPFHTEVLARFVPAVTILEAGKVQLLGFSIKHSIKEYIPAINRIPFLSTSVILGYTKYDSQIDVAYEPFNTNQKLNISATGLTGRFLLGINIPFIAVYTGVGYGSTSSQFDLDGDYTIGTTDVYNPFSLGFETKGFDANAGVRLRFGIFAIHGDYTLGDYPMASVGFGINFR